jgi:hypothetical protein
MELVQLRQYDNYFNAHLAKNKLASLGIESFLFDENTMSAYQFLDIALGGIKLKVAQIDVETALEILDTYKL